MKVLLIAYHFPPAPAVGSLRAVKVARALRDRGHQVIVITARRPQDASTFRTQEEGIVVRTVKPLPGLRDIYNWFRKSKASGTAGNPASPTGKKWTAPAPGWKRFLLSLMWFPDDRHGFVIPALLVSLTQIVKGVNVVYTTVPPFSTYLVGLGLRLLTWRRWVIEVRDPWTPGTWKPHNTRTRVSDVIEAWLERRCFRTSSLIVCVSEGIASMCKASLPEGQHSKVVVVRNGIDKLSPPRRASEVSDQLVRIVYVGTVYYHRDPRPFLKAIANVRNEIGRPLSVEFVGDCRWFHDVSIEAEVQTLGIANIVTFRDWLPQVECQKIIENADILLLLAQNQPSQIPNKLYDYMGMRVPIIAFADSDGESARMLNSIGGHLVISSSDEEDVRRGVIAALQHVGKPNGQQAEATLRDWTSKSQMERLVRVLEGVGTSGKSTDPTGPATERSPEYSDS